MFHWCTLSNDFEIFYFHETYKKIHLSSPSSLIFTQGKSFSCFTETDSKDFFVLLRDVLISSPFTFVPKFYYFLLCLPLTGKKFRGEFLIVQKYNESNCDTRECNSKGSHFPEGYGVGKLRKINFSRINLFWINGLRKMMRTIQSLASKKDFSSARNSPF